MFTTPAKTTECCRGEPVGCDHAFASRATAPVTAKKSAASLHDTQRSASRACQMRRRAKTSTTRCPIKTHRRRKCTTALNILRKAQPSVARSARESLASSDTTLGRLLSARKGAPADSRLAEKTTGDSCLVFWPPDKVRGRVPRLFPEVHD
jgi:hypothetical protein